MDILKELTTIVNKNRIKHLSSLGQKRKSKIQELYQAIINQKVKTDEEAATYLLGDNHKGSGYRNIKKRLKQELINHVFFIDLKRPLYSDQQRAYYNCWKEWAAAKILLGRGALKASLDICHRILPLAQKYEFTELSLTMLRTLRSHYGTLEGDAPKFELYNAMYKEYESIWNAESLAEELYTELILHYSNPKGDKTLLFQKASSYYQRLKPLMEQFDAYKLHLCGQLIRIMKFMSQHDYQSTATICKDAILFFQQKPYQARIALQILWHQQLVCHIQLKQFEEGKRVAKACLELIPEGNYNWFKQQELFLLLALHTQNYEEGYKIYRDTMEQKRFTFLPQRTQELWRIYNGYLHYLLQLKKIPAPDSVLVKKQFRMGKFLNEVPIYSKDKRGMNIPILIIQILFLILNNQYDKAIDRIEAIEKYCSRYLRQDGTFRSNCFIKMLLQIPIHGFDASSIEQNAKKYRDQLVRVPLELANQAHEIEIIPYEDLWELAIQSLRVN